MKVRVVAAIVVILLAGAGIAYFLLFSPPTSNPTTDTGTNASSTFITITTPQTQNTRQTTSARVTSMTAEVTANIAFCNASDKACTITLVNTGGIAVEATGCTLNGQPGVFAPPSSNVPPGGSVNVSCAPSAGGAIPIPGFHVEGSIRLSDGSLVNYIGTWA